MVKTTTYIVHVIDAGREQPVEVRIRQWLKIGLRGLGLRCTDIRQDNPRQTPGEPRSGGGQGKDSTQTPKRGRIDPRPLYGNRSKNEQ